MAEKPIWMPWYVADYIVDTAHLTRAQHGSYLLMIAYAWMHDGLLPDHEGRLASIAHCTASDWAADRDALMAFWSPTAGGYRQKRLDVEMDKARAMIEQRRGAGKASAERRWGKAKRKVTLV